MRPRCASILGSVTSRLTAFRAKAFPPRPRPSGVSTDDIGGKNCRQSAFGPLFASISIRTTLAQAWLGRQSKHCQSHRGTPLCRCGGARNPSPPPAVNGLFVASASSAAGSHSGRPCRHLRCCAAHHSASTIRCRRSLEDLRAPELLSATAKTLSDFRPPELLRSAVKTLGNLRSPKLLRSAAKTLGNLRSPELLGGSVIPLGRIPANLGAPELLRSRAFRLRRPIADLRSSEFLPRPLPAARDLPCCRRAAPDYGSLRAWTAGCAWLVAQIARSRRCCAWYRAVRRGIRPAPPGFASPPA